MLLYSQDVGGRESLRPYWRHFYTGTQGVVFVVDASDVARLETASAELAALAADAQLVGVPILLVANRTGTAGALGRDALLARLGLSDTDPSAGALHGHAWELHLCGALGGSTDTSDPAPPALDVLKPGLAFLLRSMPRL